MPQNIETPNEKIYYLIPKSDRFDIIEKRITSQRNDAFLIAMKCKNGEGKVGWIHREVIETFFNIVGE